MLGTAVFYVIKKWFKCYFCLAQNKVINPVKFIMLCGKKRASGNYLSAQLIATLHNVSYRFLLHRHGTDEDVVGPLDLFVPEIGGVHVNQLLLPFLR